MTNPIVRVISEDGSVAQVNLANLDREPKGEADLTLEVGVPWSEQQFFDTLMGQMGVAGIARLLARLLDCLTSGDPPVIISLPTGDSTSAMPGAEIADAIASGSAVGNLPSS